jgi:hypothetical protein
MAYVNQIKLMRRIRREKRVKIEPSKKGGKKDDTLSKEYLHILFIALT